MDTIAAQLTELVREAAARAGHADSPVALERCVRTNNADHGDYQSNFAFRLGKALKTNPRALAEKLKEQLPGHPMVASVDVAGPGFLNFKLDDGWLAEDVAARSVHETLGTPQTGVGRTMVIDFSSPNIAKRMHVGHLRSTVIGDSIHRIHEFLGWRVIADNHVGDWGKQFGMLIVAWEEWRDEEAYSRDPIGEMQRLYQLFGVKAKEDPALQDRARAETAKLQKGDPTNRALWQRFVQESMREFNAIYARMGVEFDIAQGESFYDPMFDDLVADFLARGLAVHSDGAIVVPFAEGEVQLSTTPLMLRKSDGAAGYGTSDLATIQHRMATYNPEIIAYVVDDRQRPHFEQVFAAARKAGFRASCHHIYFGILRFGDGQIAAARAGGALNLVDVLDTAAAQARAIVDEKSGQLSEDERARIAEAIGIATIKYADLSQNPQSDILFEWSRVLSWTGNTAAYLMYQYARCRSLFAKAIERGGSTFVVEPGSVRLAHPLERELALSIARMSEAILESAATWRPNVVADQLYEVAQTFARFFTECRVLGDDVPPDVTASRLALVLGTSHALDVGLGLLGVRTVERM